MSAHKHYTVAAVPAGEAKDIGAMIVTTLISAGVLVPAAWLGSMMARDLVSALDNAINAVRDSITYLRFGADLQDLQRVVDELQAAGVQVPAKVQAIVNNPHDGDYGTSADLNIEYARGWLETTLRMLQDAQERAESMPDEQRSDQEPREEKTVRNPSPTRDLEQEIFDRRREFEALKQEAERVVATERSPTVVRNALEDYDQRAAEIYWKVPVKDYEAEEIEEGQQLADDIRDFQTWIEEQMSRFQINSAPRSSAKNGAHTLYR